MGQEAGGGEGGGGGGGAACTFGDAANRLRRLLGPLESEFCVPVF